MNTLQNSSTFYPKNLSKFELYSLGIPDENFEAVENIDELKNNPPNIIIADCVNRIDRKSRNIAKKSFKALKYEQNKFIEQELIKKHKYVMSLGIYNQLHYDKRYGVEILKPSRVKFNKIYRHYFGQDLTNKTLLVFRQGGIGDLLFIQPNLIYLKEKYPSCTIKFACSPQYQSMIQEWDCIDEILDLPFEVSELYRSDYHCIFEGVIERCKEAETTCSYNLFTKWMGLNLPDELLIPKQESNNSPEFIEKNLKNLEELGINKDEKYIVLQMRASSIIRTPSPDVWKKLINKLTEKDYKIVITDMPHKTADIDNFINTLDKKDNVKNFSSFSNTISDTIFITKNSQMAIGTDSSLVHIAESLGVKSFSIMGPFPGKIRYSTYKHNDYIDVIKDGCSPCFKHISQPCKNSTFSGYSLCYNNLDYDLCIEKIERLLNK